MSMIGRREILKSSMSAGVMFATPALLAQDTTNDSGNRAAPQDRTSKQGAIVESGPKITTFLMFEGKAEEAMNFYVSLFENSKIIDLKRYGPNEMGKEGSVLLAAFSLNGQTFKCIDSPVKHGFTFTPAISLYVSCTDEAKITRYFEALSADGQVLMPLAEYPFSKKFAWVNDRFGVSWQLSV